MPSLKPSKERSGLPSLEPSKKTSTLPPFIDGDGLGLMALDICLNLQQHQIDCDADINGMYGVYIYKREKIFL